MHSGDEGSFSSAIHVSIRNFFFHLILKFLPEGEEKYN